MGMLRQMTRSKLLTLKYRLTVLVNRSITNVMVSKNGTRLLQLKIM